ncbi:MAG: SUMF1/EgtB/PvdO family nonheme iron enzyme, partial [Chloroflexi bacterium]|nr:SUMF1/EgtB/PvdO family nonheme iron enzyme [Chloroflexota bacterium]
IDETVTGVGPHDLQRTAPVDAYPQGESPVGALGMSGNVWEWCLNEYDRPENISLSGDNNRVLRGGSWNYDRLDARAAYRYGHFPAARYDSFGFRLVRAPSR